MKARWPQKELGQLAELKGRIGWRGLTAKEYTKTGPLFLSVHSLNYGDYVDFRDAYRARIFKQSSTPGSMVPPPHTCISGTSLSFQSSSHPSPNSTAGFQKYLYEQGA